MKNLREFFLLFAQGDCKLRPAGTARIKADRRSEPCPGPVNVKYEMCCRLAATEDVY
jgi:hypothetical protein